MKDEMAGEQAAGKAQEQVHERGRGRRSTGEQTQPEAWPLLAVSPSPDRLYGFLFVYRSLEQQKYKEA